jgi:calcineurin-like phosphoesterase family protein
MANIFLVSDTHFGHANILNFTTRDGGKVRDFASVDEMNETMIERWNKVVKPEDKVYHLGDVAMSKRDIPLVGRCNGHKRLVRGNHDDHNIKLYLPYFEEIYATRLLDNMLLSHIPVHPESLMGRGVNIHGHVHNNVSPLHFGPNYLNVSVEVIDYTPISLEEAKQIFQIRGCFNEQKP